MENKEVPWEVSYCADCIQPQNYADGSDSETVKTSKTIYDGFIVDDSDGFQSDMCRGCEEGIVPSHLPIEQVIRFIKRIFDKHNITI